MVLITLLATFGSFWVAMGLVGLIAGRRRAEAWRLLLVILFTYLVVDFAIKPIVARSRPFEVVPDLTVLIQRPTTWSFPSGHAAWGVAGAIAGTRLFPGAGWLLWPFGVLVGISRVYVGVHWPSDVLGGALVGAACAWFALGGRSTAKMGARM